MKRSLTRLISESLLLPDDALVYDISRRLADLFPEKHVLETDEYSFDLARYAQSGKCSLHVLDDTHAQVLASWEGREKQILMIARNAFYEVLWRGRRLHVLTVTYGRFDSEHHYILADRADDAREFFAAVCAWDDEVTGEILVWDGDCWMRDSRLISDIERASLDHLVLPGDLRDQLAADFEGFFSAHDLYREMGVAWKRGILLLGPPGNGKTHLIKAMIQRLSRPCLYVRSFKSSDATAQASIAAVFRKARQVAPCLVVLEDLDSLVDDDNRSFFLNEMDGFAENEGILTVATTNHPEKLDPALLERPSRFDRKITFTLPAEPERRRFLAMANERREPAAQVTEAELDELASLTKGFSFAYLKELGLSGLMAWMRNPVPGGMGDAMRGQVEILRQQIRPPKTAKKGK